MLYNNKKEAGVFQEINRKMKYGAPELKQHYRKFLAKGLITAIVVAAVLSVSSLQYFLKAGEKTEIDVQTSERKIVITDAEIEIPVKEAPEIVTKNVPLKDLSALTPVPAPKRNVKENVKLKTQDELENVKVPVSSEGTEEESQVASQETGKLDDVKIEKQVEKIKEVPKKPAELFEVDKAPVATNLGSIKSSLDYPEIARLSGAEGRVVARVLVGTDGSVIRIGSISGPAVFHDEVSKKIMRLQFTPAMQQNKTVMCWVSVPFNFKLKNDYR